MNKLKLSKLTSHEKAFKLIHYASLIGRINYIYHRYNFFLPHSDVGLDMKYLFRKAYESFDGKEWRRLGVEEDFKDEDRSQN